MQLGSLGFLSIQMKKQLTSFALIGRLISVRCTIDMLPIFYSL